MNKTTPVALLSFVSLCFPAVAADLAPVAAVAPVAPVAPVTPKLPAPTLTPLPTITAPTPTVLAPAPGRLPTGGAPAITPALTTTRLPALAPDTLPGTTVQGVRPAAATDGMARKPAEAPGLATAPGLQRAPGERGLERASEASGERKPGENVRTQVEQNRDKLANVRGRMLKAETAGTDPVNAGAGRTAAQAGGQAAAAQ